MELSLRFEMFFVFEHSPRAAHAWLGLHAININASGSIAVTVRQNGLQGGCGNLVRPRSRHATEHATPFPVFAHAH